MNFKNASNEGDGCAAFILKISSSVWKCAYYPFTSPSKQTCCMNSSWYTAGSRFIRFWSPGKSVASFDISFRSTNRYCLGKTLGSCGFAETPFRFFVSTCEFKQTGVQILRSIVLHFLVLLLRTMELLMDVTHQRLLRSLRVHHLRHRGIRSLRKPLQRGESGNSILRLHVIPQPSPQPDSCICPHPAQQLTRPPCSPSPTPPTLNAPSQPHVNRSERSTMAAPGSVELHHHVPLSVHHGIEVVLIQHKLLFTMDPSPPTTFPFSNSSFTNCRRTFSIPLSFAYSFPSFAIPRSAFSVFSFSSTTAPSPEAITSFITL